MLMKCSYHGETHNSDTWRSNVHGTFCAEAVDILEQPEEEPFYIGVQRTDARLDHWGNIKSRVTTHEGEILSGTKGRDYQIKYSKRYLGKDMSAPPVFKDAQYQKQLAKKK